MGEAKRRVANGEALPASQLIDKRIRVVGQVWIEGTVDGIYMILGQGRPELATGMLPENARKIAEALIAHADAFEKASPRVIIPGGGFHVVPPSPQGVVQ